MHESNSNTQKSKLPGIVEFPSHASLPIACNTNGRSS